MRLRLCHITEETCLMTFGRVAAIGKSEGRLTRSATFGTA